VARNGDRCEICAKYGDKVGLIEVRGALVCLICDCVSLWPKGLSAA
jgi:hypothetical protein